MKPTQGLFIVIALAPLPFLGACGGGSGGGSGLSSEPVQITSDNATQVAAGMPLTASLIEFQDFMSFDNLTAEGTGTFDCPDGGSITAYFEVDAAPVGEVSTGDRFAVTFDGCMLDASSTIHGGIVLDFNTIVGDWTVDDTWKVDLSFAINDLTFSSGPVTGYFDGNWSQNATYDTGDSSFSLAGQFMTSVDDGNSVRAAALSGLTLTWDYDAVAAEATYTVEGQFASTELNGAVMLTTTTPFVIQDGASYPHAGALVITGAAGSRLTFTVLDDTFVRLDVDADGDGIDEFSVTTTWFELDA